MMRTPEPILRFICEFCKEAFSQSRLLSKHKFNHHSVKYPTKDYVCDCDMRTQSYAITGKKYLKCNMCEKGFTYSSSLTRHKRIHTGEKPYKCDLCEKGFAESSKLTIHCLLYTSPSPRDS